MPSHLDVMANVLSTDRGLRLIDFEYARSAPPARELGQLIWEGELDRRGADRLVSSYQPGAAGGRRRRCRRGNLVRPLSRHLDGLGAGPAGRRDAAVRPPIMGTPGGHWARPPGL